MNEDDEWSLDDDSYSAPPQGIEVLDRVQLLTESKATILISLPVTSSLLRFVNQSADGTDLFYFVHEQFFAGVDKERIPLLAEWAVHLLRSPLRRACKMWFLQLVHRRIACKFPEATARPENLQVRACFRRLDFAFLTRRLFFQTRLIAHCLATNCPFTPWRAMYCNAIPIEPAVLPYIQRKDAKYGVYFCNTSTLSELQKAGLQVCVIDIAVQASSPDVTPDMLYLQIIQQFSGSRAWDALMLGLR